VFSETGYRIHAAPAACNGWSGLKETLRCKEVRRLKEFAHYYEENTKRSLMHKKTARQMI
jgi:hypothetical protein